MKPFVLLINGPQCAGKSTVAELILNSYPNLFHLTGDKIKWLISDYAQSKPQYTESDVVNKLLFKLAQAASIEGFSLVIETNIGLMKSWTEKYKELAEANNSAYLEFNIEAPYEILKQRFEQRVKSAEFQGTNISVKTESDMKIRYEGYQSYKNEKVATFDSSEMSPQDIFNAIMKELQ